MVLNFGDGSNDSIVHDVIVNMDASYDSRCVYINGYSDNNIFYNNVFNNSEQPVRIWSDGSTDNMFYHNNFINNINPPYDYSVGNYFYNPTLCEGNYYDDYTGEDSDGDGIGDTPYDIPGGSNQDLYPLINPWGEQRPVANFTYNAEESPVVFDGSLSYDRDGEIILYEWDFGDGNTGSGIIVHHKYCEVGYYDVTLTVTDDDGFVGNTTKSIEVTNANTRPSIEIFGPNKGKPNKNYEYAFIVTVPDDDEFYIWIDWGDNDSTEWLGPYISGETLKKSHTWDEDGTYVIRAKAKDSCGESDWFNFQVIIPRSRLTFNNIFLQLLMKHLNSFTIVKFLLGL